MLCRANTHLATSDASVIPQLCILTTSYDLLAKEHLDDVRNTISATEAVVPQMLAFRALSDLSNSHYVSLTSIFQRLPDSDSRGRAGATALAPRPIFVYSGSDAVDELQEWVSKFAGSHPGLAGDGRPCILASHEETALAALRSLADCGSEIARPWLCAVPEVVSNEDSTTSRLAGFIHHGSIDSNTGAGTDGFQTFQSSSGGEDPVVVAFTVPWDTEEPPQNTHSPGVESEDSDEHDLLDFGDEVDWDDVITWPDNGNAVEVTDDCVYGADLVGQLFGDMALLKNDVHTTGPESYEISEAAGCLPAQSEALWLRRSLGDAVSPLNLALHTMDESKGDFVEGGGETEDEHVSVDEEEELLMASFGAGQQTDNAEEDDWESLEQMRELPPVFLLPLSNAIVSSPDAGTRAVAGTEKSSSGTDGTFRNVRHVVRTGVDRTTDILLHRHITEGIPIVLPVAGDLNKNEECDGGYRAALAWIQDFHRTGAREPAIEDPAHNGQGFELEIELGRQVQVHRAWTIPHSFGVRMAEISIPRKK